jgi:hypothetical protein
MSSVLSDIIGKGITHEIVQERSTFKTLLAMGISQGDLKVIQNDIVLRFRREGPLTQRL